MKRDERGFTLVELTITITIEALLVVALGMGFSVMLNGTKSVNQSLARSGDARLAAAYLSADAGNSSGPEVSLSDTTSCPDPSPPVAGTASPVARFTWDSTSSTGATTTNITNYVLVSNSLLRRQCKNGTLVGDHAVASNVQSVTAACSPTADCSGTPDSITLTVTELADSNGAVYSYKLTGSFRKLDGGGPTTPTNPNAVMTLGSGTNCPLGGTGISLTASASFVAYGNVNVNSINNACKALSMTSNSTYQAGGTNILTGGTCASTTGASPCPTYTSYSPALTDPYANLPTPANGTARSGCSGGVAQPGVYAATLTVSATTCQLASGVYVLQQGLTVSGTSSGSASLTSAAGGVLIYVTGGSIATSGSSSHPASINLSAMTTGSYSGVVMWQDDSDTNNVGFPSGNITLNGALYAPTANVNFGSSSPVANITQIVSQTIWMANGSLTIGTPSATPLSITGPTSYALAWTVNRVYPSATLTAAGGDGNYTWTVTGLPPGVSADPVTGIVSGTPTTAGSYSGTVTLSDLLGDAPIVGAFNLVVNAAPNITTVSLPAGDKTVPYTKTLAASGGTTNYSWGATGLPTGLSINASTGVISGTPTGTAGTATVVVTLTDAAGATDTQSLSLTINNVPNITTASLPSGEKTAPYSTTLAATSGTAPYTWSATGLPSGLSMSSGGVLSGTPSGSAGTSTVVAKIVDAAGGIDTQSLSLVIGAQPTISSVTLANKTTSPTGTAGTIEQGDTITIVYSAQMDVSDFCSAWSSDTSDQSLVANSDVTVTVTDTSPNDLLTVSSGTCTFNLGTINLGSGSYVSSTATFKGSTTATKSTITWDESARTLVITLGAKTAGTVANVSSSTPTYTAPSSLSDTAGGLLGNSPFTLPTGKKF